MTRFIVLAVLIWSVAAQAFADPPTAELIEVTKIWDRAPHSAFSDLICWRDRFVCASARAAAMCRPTGRFACLLPPTQTRGRPPP